MNAAAVSTITTSAGQTTTTIRRHLCNPLRLRLRPKCGLLGAEPPINIKLSTNLWISRAPAAVDLAPRRPVLEPIAPLHHPSVGSVRHLSSPPIRTDRHHVRSPHSALTPVAKLPPPPPLPQPVQSVSSPLRRRIRACRASSRCR